jgi:hypothetical protein
LGNDSGDVITINGTTTFGSGATVSSPLALSAGTASAPALTTTGDTNTGIFFPAADTIAFAEGGAEVARFNSSGNLGLGVTPDAWASYKALQIGVTSISGNNTDLEISSNAYFNGGWKYASTSGGATRYSQQENAFGTHAWYTAFSGTAGNAISFTQAMTLGADGNLAVGATSTSARIASISAPGSVQFRWSDATNGTANLDHASGVSRIWTNIGLAFGTGGESFTERARIDSSGRLLVGGTNSFSSAGTPVVCNTTANGFLANTTAASGTGFIMFGGWSNAANVNTPGTLRFVVYDSGNVLNWNNSYGGISDVKLKENIADATPKLEKLNQVRVVNYNLIGDTHKQIGVIAQELEQIFPGMVEETADRDEEGIDLGTTTKSVKYSVFVPMLIKAIQEQQALIQTLTARVTALEGTQP